jgi:hypothetical protein
MMKSRQTEFFILRWLLWKTINVNLVNMKN